MPTARPAPGPGPAVARRPDDLRRRNLAALLRLVHLQGPTSRAALGEALALNRSTVGSLTAELAAAGLVTEQPPARTASVGRPSLVVAPRTEVHALVCEVAVDRVTVARVGLGGTVLEVREEQLATPPAFDAGVDLVRRLAAALRRATPTDATCVGVGASVPGTVRASDGLVRLAPNLGWADARLGGLLEQTLGLGLPVRVGNDADLGALAEHLRGAGRDCSDLVFLCGRVGLGAGVITSGRPLSGANGYGGEVGHLVVNPGGRPCHCGAAGCWETEVSEDALLGDAPDRGPGGVARLVRDAAAGVPSAVAAVAEVGHWLAIGLAGLVNVVDPQVVVFGGHLATVLPAVHGLLEDRLALGAFGRHREPVRLLVPALGERSTLLGAAELAFAALLDDPVGHLARLAARPGGPALRLPALAT